MKTSVGPTWLEVDLGAVKRNIQRVKALVGPGTGVMPVVKANAYGHGLVPVARAAEEAGAAGLGVARVAEGVALREAGIKLPVLVMAAASLEEASPACNANLTCAVSSEPFLQALEQAARIAGRPARIHVKVDTGMGRIGFAPERMPAIIAGVLGRPLLKITGIFSHLSSAEDDEDYTELQWQRLMNVRTRLKDAGLARQEWQWHLCNSAGTVRLPNGRLDLVRVGLLIYGVNPLPEDTLKLEPTLRWKAVVTCVKECPPGSPISYGKTFVTPHRMTVATIPAGYADGYPRSLSNRGEALIRGIRAQVIGRVCMDQLMIEAPFGVAVGDEVVLIGDQGNESISPEALALRAGTISHEILSRLATRLPRVYRNERQSIEGRGEDCRAEREQG